VLSMSYSINDDLCGSLLVMLDLFSLPLWLLLERYLFTDAETDAKSMNDYLNMMLRISPSICVVGVPPMI